MTDNSGVASFCSSSRCRPLGCRVGDNFTFNCLASRGIVLDTPWESFLSIIMSEQTVSLKLHLLYFKGVLLLQDGNGLIAPGTEAWICGVEF